MFTNELIFTLLQSKTSLYRYDLRPFFTGGIIIIECIIILLTLKPRKKYPFILTTIVFNIIALYLPIHLYPWDPLEIQKVFKNAPIISYGVMGLKIILVVGIGYLILKEHYENKKMLFKTLLIINIITMVTALIVESLIFGQFHPYYGFM